ncbi:MAG: 3-hydroxybutyryl-CoA dehydrogenase [Planctomycetes bacterium]|nr:3-hydroxybutyryl-CoA dehydrogenase [Planctomycetota bacterium]
MTETEARIERVGVIGCGLMGHGIAQVVAQAGIPVVVHEMVEDALARGFARIEGSLAKLVEKGKLSESDRDATLARMTRTTNLGDLASCDLVVEAIVEDLDTKKTLFAQLDDVVDPKAIFASNTSSYPIDEMAVSTGRLERFIGLHFFNPVQLMKLVEVVRLDGTSDDVLEAVLAFARRIGKHPVVAADTPGFIVNRLLVPLMVEAIRMVERGDASAADVDAAMQFGAGHPMGPLTLTDYVGLDTTLFILEGWHARFPEEPAFEPPAMLRRLVEEGRLGRKSGRGFYEWEGDKRK